MPFNVKMGVSLKEHTGQSSNVKHVPNDNPNAQKRFVWIYGHPRLELPQSSDVHREESQLV